MNVQLVYRIYDPTEEKFCNSGRGLYAQNGRSIWMTKGGATLAKNNMPQDIRGRFIIKEYRLVEVK